MAVKKAISIRKAELMEQRVINCEGDQKKLFSHIHSLFGSKKITVLPEYNSSFTLSSSINMFLLRKFIRSVVSSGHILQRRSVIFAGG